jgi:hypothetical protein
VREFVRTWLVEQTSWKGARYEDVGVLFARRSGGVDRAAAGLSVRGRRAVAARRSAGAPGARLRGTGGAGHGHPHGPVPCDTLDESGDPQRTVGEGGSRRGRTAPGEWEPGNLES